MRNSSLVLLWAAPLYEGRSAVTGYLLEISQGDQSDNWIALNKKTVSDTHYKVSGAVKMLTSVSFLIRIHPLPDLTMPVMYKV